MTKFVLAFNRRTAKLDVFERFQDSALAVRRRIALEDAYPGSDWEVAVLSSSDEETLRSTHSRYFARSA